MAGGGGRCGRSLSGGSGGAVRAALARAPAEGRRGARSLARSRGRPRDSAPPPLPPFLRFSAFFFSFFISNKYKSGGGAAASGHAYKTGGQPMGSGPASVNQPENTWWEEQKKKQSSGEPIRKSSAPSPVPGAGAAPPIASSLGGVQRERKSRPLRRGDSQGAGAVSSTPRWAGLGGSHALLRRGPAGAFTRWAWPHPLFPAVPIGRAPPAAEGRGLLRAPPTWGRGPTTPRPHFCKPTRAPLARGRGVLNHPPSQEGEYWSPTPWAWPVSSPTPSSAAVTNKAEPCLQGGVV